MFTTVRTKYARGAVIYLAAATGVLIRSARSGVYPCLAAIIVLSAVAWLGNCVLHTFDASDQHAATQRKERLDGPLSGGHRG